MRTASISEVHDDLESALDRVARDHEPLLITRDGGKAPGVLISAEDFASYEETSYLLSQPRNAKRLAQAIEQLGSGKGIERQLAE